MPNIEERKKTLREKLVRTQATYSQRCSPARDCSRPLAEGKGSGRLLADSLRKELWQERKVKTRLWGGGWQKVESKCAFFSNEFGVFGGFFLESVVDSKCVRDLVFRDLREDLPSIRVLCRGGGSEKVT